MPHASELGIDDVLDVVTETFGIEDGNLSGDEYGFLCIVHDDSNPSCRVNTETGLWGCWSCGASGDLIDLGIAALLEDGILMGRARNGKERRKRRAQRDEIEAILSPKNIDAMAARIRRRIRSQQKKIRNNPAYKRKATLSVPPLGSYEDGPLDSLYARGFTEDFLRDRGVRFVTSARLAKQDGEEFEITNSVAIPIVESDGETMIGWCYRATDDSESWQPRYLYTPQIELSEIWFGLDSAADSPDVTVTEGALDSMWLAMHGYPSVAILGSNVKSPRKLRKLAEWESVCLFPDDDNAGFIWASRVGRSLQEMGVPCSVTRLATFMLNRHGDPAKDANDLCGLDLELVRELAIPYQAWKRRNTAF